MLTLVQILWLLAFAAGVGLIVWGAEAFAGHLAGASVRLGVSGFALALLLAGAEPEELATVVAASVKHAPAIAFGDVIGANAAMCLVALAIGAMVAPLPFRGAVRRYALLALPIGAAGAWVAWDGRVSRLAGIGLIGLYGLYVGLIWRLERRPPLLGEAGEIAEAQEQAVADDAPRRIGWDLALVCVGVAAMALGGWLLVEAVLRLVGAPAEQLRIGLTLVGFATAFELVALAFASARRGAPEMAIAGIVGSFAYNMTMTLGAGAVARPLTIADAALLHAPLLAMLAALVLPIALAARTGHLSRGSGGVLLAVYGGFLVLVLA